MRWIMQRLADISLGRAWRVISDPRIVPVILTAPPPVSNVNAIISFFPHLTRESVNACRLEFLKNNRFFEELNSKMIETKISTNGL